MVKASRIIKFASRDIDIKIYDLLTEGFTDKYIASKVNLSIQSIRRIVHFLYEEAGVSSSNDSINLRVRGTKYWLDNRHEYTNESVVIGGFTLPLGNKISINDIYKQLSDQANLSNVSLKDGDRLVSEIKFDVSKFGLRNVVRILVK